MKKILVIAALTLALPAYGIVYTGNSDWTQPFASDAYTAGLWHFNETTGDTLVADASGNNPDGTFETFSGDPDDGLDPNTTWQTSTVPYSGFGNMVSTSSDSNGRIEIAGSSDTTGGNPLFMGPDQDFTIEFWMNNGTNNFMDPGDVMVMSKYSWDYLCQGYYWPDWYDDPRISIGWNNDWAPSGNGIDPGSTDGIPVVMGAWTHFAFTVDRTSYVPPNPWDPMMHTARFFVNGVLVQEQQTDNIMFEYFAGEVNLLGRSTDDRAGYVGDIDEMRISSVQRYIPEPSMLTLLAIALGARVLRKKK